MAKKVIVKAPEKPEKEKVYSKRYRCLITKETAYMDDGGDWRNETIEEQLKDNKNYNKEKII